MRPNVLLLIFVPDIHLRGMVEEYVNHMHMQTKRPVLVVFCTAICTQFINLLVDFVQDGLSKEEFL